MGDSGHLEERRMHFENVSFLNSGEKQTRKHTERLLIAFTGLHASSDSQWDNSFQEVWGLFEVQGHLGTREDTAWGCG